MASTFPTSLDAIPASPTTEALGGSTPTHPEMHDLLRDAIAAVEARIGVTNSNDTSTITNRLSAQGEGTAINEVASKATPADADLLGLSDSAASGVLKKLSWANLKAALTSVFSTPAAVAAAVTSHEGASDPHPQYTTAAEVASLAPAETTTTTGSLITGATDKTTPVDSDLLGLVDSAASWITKKLSWASLKAAVLLAVFGAGHPRAVFHTAKPWILPSAGTLNAGAAGAATITGMTTALPRTYSGPGKIYVPAVGSWGGGWLDFLSATTTTVTLADAVATGGAYSMAALAGVDITGPSYTLSGGEMGPNGLLEHDFLINTNNSAGAKTFKILAGATSIGGGAGNYTTSVSARSLWYTAAAGAQNKQTFMNNTGLTVYGTVALQILGLAAVDFSVDQTISITLRTAVANDILILERLTERLTYGA